MLLGGLWHGANWTFVAWGAIHGVYVIVYNGSRKAVGNINLGLIGKACGILLTFFIVTIAWVFFRAGSIGEAVHFLVHVFHGADQVWFGYLTIREVVYAGGWHIFVMLLFVFLLFSEEVLARNDGRFTKLTLIDSMWLGLVVFLVLTMGIYNQNAFIYFQF